MRGVVFCLVALACGVCSAAVPGDYVQSANGHGGVYVRLGTSGPNLLMGDSPTWNEEALGPIPSAYVFLYVISGWDANGKPLVSPSLVFAASIGASVGTDPPMKDTTGTIPQNAADGKNLVLRLLQRGKIRDYDNDGHTDGDDVRRFLTDMDNDGIPNANDPDKDGDGELDRYERIGTEPDPDFLREWDPASYPDRDGDGRADFFDSDGDGYPNWIENLWFKKSTLEEVPLGVIPQTDPNSHPNGWGWIINDNPSSFDYGRHAVTEYRGPGGLGAALDDTDGDGAANWWELIYGSDPTDPDDFPDGDHDGRIDFLSNRPGAAPTEEPIRVALPPKPPTQVVGGTPTTGGEAPPSVPDPPAPTPEKPFQIAWPAKVEGAPQVTGQSSAGTPITPTNGTTTASPFTQVPTGAASSNPGYGGSFTSPATGGTGGGGGGYGGSGGGGGEGEGPGNGDYQIVDQPRGQSTAYMGVGGGSWQYRSGNDLGLTAGAEYVHAGLGAAGLRNSMGIAPSGVDATHAAVLSMKWIDGTTKTWNVPLMPDLGTASGQAADKIRFFLRLFAAIVAGYIFIGKIWTALRQG